MIKLRPDHDSIAHAAKVIAEFMQPSVVEREEVFCRQLDADVYVKYEFFNPVKSFKIRGALNIAHALKEKGDVKRVVTCSTGNHGSAMAFSCKEFGLPITVGVPVDCDRSKVELIREFGADLEFIGRDLDEAKELIQKEKSEEGSVFVEDGSAPEGFDIKGNKDSMKFHAPTSPWYARTKAEVWFRTAEAAEAAGFVNAEAKA